MAGKHHPNGAFANPIAPVKAHRRSFSAAYKLCIIEEAESYRERGQIGELLRREGLYSSHLSDWRKQRLAGQLQALAPRKRGRKKDERAAEITALRRENERLRAQLSQAELIIEAQKKLSQALETMMKDENA
jgi:transposase-like protein